MRIWMSVGFIAMLGISGCESDTRVDQRPYPTCPVGMTCFAGGVWACDKAWCCRQLNESRL